MDTIHSAEILKANETAKNDFAARDAASRLPSFAFGRWIGTTAVDAACGQIGLLFRRGDGSDCRLRLDVASARALAETIEDSLLRAGYPPLENVQPVTDSGLPSVSGCSPP